MFAGFPALRHVVSGSWFVRFFIYVCSSEAHNSDLESIITKVLNTLSLWFKTYPYFLLVGYRGGSPTAVQA